MKKYEKKQKIKKKQIKINVLKDIDRNSQKVVYLIFKYTGIKEFFFFMTFYV